jgi:hypothetical protein
MTEVPEVAYAAGHDGASIAFQVVSSGPPVGARVT